LSLQALPPVDPPFQAKTILKLVPIPQREMKPVELRGINRTVHQLKEQI
jgi:hypothetical protein